MDGSTLMRIPAEVRLMIYDYLFVDGGRRQVSIRNVAPDAMAKKTSDDLHRTKYHILEHSFHRRCCQTTYQLASEGVEFCAALMRVNRQTYRETSYLVYGKHTFDFGAHIEAVEPFLADLTPANRAFVREIELYKRGPIPFYENDKTEWRGLCRFLKTFGGLRKLRLIVQGGRPAVPWEGPKELSAAELGFLSAIKTESLEWVDELTQVGGIEELELVPHMTFCPPPKSTAMLVYCAYSNSIDKGLADFVRQRMQLPLAA